MIYNGETDSVDGRCYVAHVQRSVDPSFISEPIPPESLTPELFDSLKQPVEKTHLSNQHK